MDRKANVPDTYKTVDLVATYEDLFNISHDQKVTHYFGDYGGHYFNYGISQEQKNAAYEKALAAIETNSTDYQRGAVYRENTII